MIRTGALVALISALGWLFLNWRGYNADVAAAGWNRKKQFQMALVWIAIFASMTLIVSHFSP